MKNKKDEQKILATSAILLIDAMVFQEVLARKDPAIETLSSIRYKQNTKKSFEDVWTEILKKNYQPIFKIAQDILKSLPASSNVNAGLKDLIEIAYDIASSPILLKHDLFGRVYHTLLLGKLIKYYATLYTSIPAARLLARLLINLSSIDMKIPLKFEGEPFRVVDFACGSGTLLSAIYKELELKYRLEAESLNIEDFHKYLIEEGLWGFDVLQHATHLTMTTLSLHNPSPIRDSRIYALKLGIEGKEYHLGSIDFLESPYLKTTELLGGGKVGPVKSSVAEKEIAEVELPIFHICIMNPPFTRSAIGNLLFGALPSSERAILQRDLSRLLNRKGLSGIGQAGSAAVFVFVADRYLVKGGRLGLVLPRSTLSGSSWKKVREKLLSDYHVEYIITSFEGGNNWNFSENTNLSEVLIVARKLKGGEKANHTIFANLWRKPKNEIESISIGSQLLEMYNNPKLFDIHNSNASVFSIRLRGKKIGESHSAFLDENQFGHISFFAQAELNRVISLLREGILYLPKEGIIPKNLPLAPLSDIINDIGPDCGYISKTFEMDDLGVYTGFWGQRSEEVTTIAQLPNTNLKPKNADDARKIWEKRSKLLLAYRAWLPTNKTLSIIISEPVVSSMWWSIITQNEEDAKILALWLNSTLGLLLLLSVAEVTRGPWIEFKKGDKEEKSGLWGLPVVNLRKLSKKQKEALIDLYNKVANKTLKPFPEEFSDPKIKKEIDNGINEILGIKTDLSDVYEMLSRDPMITGSVLG
jgi:hypothetical protein